MRYVIMLCETRRCLALVFFFFLVCGLHFAFFFSLYCFFAVAGLGLICKLKRISYACSQFSICFKTDTHDGLLLGWCWAEPGLAGG